MSKEVILPMLAIVCVMIVIWAWMTKCGKRPCCKRSSELPTRAETRKSVKSDRSETNNDIESGSAGSGNLNTELSMAGNNRVNSTNKHGVSAVKVQLEISSAMPFERASEPNKPSSSFAASAVHQEKRNSS